MTGTFRSRGFGLYFSLLSLLLLLPVATQVQPAYGGGKSPYQSGYDHGCSDARISSPSDRYINQPGKGPGFHTPEFMSGYRAGFGSCSGGGSNGGGGNGGGGTFFEGQQDGKREGYRDAINGRQFDDRCPSGKNNDYCLGYKLAYDWEYWVTRGLPRK
jgi:hypothetical protein